MPKFEGHPRRERRGHPALPASVKWFGDLSQAEFEIDFYERIIARNPRYIHVLRCLGELLARNGQFERSLQIDRCLVALLPDDCVARYNLACSLARGGSRRQAIEQLGLAIEHGYDDFGHLEVDPDLDSLRSEPAYIALMERYGIKN